MVHYVSIPGLLSSGPAQSVWPLPRRDIKKDERKGWLVSHKKLQSCTGTHFSQAFFAGQQGQKVSHCKHMMPRVNPRQVRSTANKLRHLWVAYLSSGTVQQGKAIGAKFIFYFFTNSKQSTVLIIQTMSAQMNGCGRAPQRPGLAS